MNMMPKPELLSIEAIRLETLTRKVAEELVALSDPNDMVSVIKSNWIHITYVGRGSESYELSLSGEFSDKTRIAYQEALIALANGEEVEARHKQTGMGWSNAMTLNLFSFKSGMFEFRLKPRTITINGIEMPAPFEPKEGDEYFYIHSCVASGYAIAQFEGIESDFKIMQFGAWRTEEEIKQVVAALRQVFGGSHDN